MVAILGGSYITDIVDTDNSQFASSNWPVTWVGWGLSDRPFARIDAGTANQIVWNVANTTVAPNPPGYVAAAHVDDDFDPGHAAIIPGTYDVTGWHHYAARFDSDTSRTVYIDGGTLGGGTQSTNTASVGLSLSNPSFGLASTSPVCEIACWKASLSDAEIAFLAAGGKPHQLENHKSNLIYYVPSRNHAWDDQTYNVTPDGARVPTENGMISPPFFQYD